jgi:hypothetical protein
MFVLSRLMSGRMTGGGVKALSNDRTHELLVRASAVFEEWPERFYEFVESRRARYSGARSHCVRKQFGELYQNLLYLPRLACAELSFFRDGFSDYLELRWDGLRGRRANKARCYVTKTEAVERLGISKRWLRRFIASGILKTVVRHGTGSDFVRVETESVERLKARLSRTVDARVLAKALGIGHWAVNNLVKTGCLSPVRGKGVDGFRRLLFDEQAGDDLLRKIKNLLGEDELTLGAASDLRTLVNRFRPMNASFSVKLKAILDGRLLPDKSPAPAESLLLPF